MSVDVQCTNCGRESSHPQVRQHFAYAAFYYKPSSSMTPPRTYIAALCAPCDEADRQHGVGTARNRFLKYLRHWSSLGANHGQIVRIVEHPEGVTGEEREGDSCFCDGDLHSYRALTTAKAR